MIKLCLICNKEFKTHLSEVRRSGGKFCSKKCYGLSRVKIRYCFCLNCGIDFKRTASQKTFGKYCSTFCSRTKKQSKESRLKISLSKRGKNFGLLGSKSPNWRGGRCSQKKLIRSSLEYREWRKAVFERDNYTCQTCKVRGKIMNAHHIKPFAFFPELRFSLENGLTLCTECHLKTDSFGRPTSKNYEKQILLETFSC